MFSFVRILTDGFMLSVGLSILILGSLYINPRIWLHDYPKEIQAKVPPKTPQEKRATRIAGFLFMLILVGTLIYSVTQLKAENGGSITFIHAFFHVFLVFNIFNLVDALILDYLIITLITPKFIIIPGSEGMEYLFRNWSTQISNYLKGIVFCAIFSLPIALLISMTP
jgi:hypothetical protein